VGYQVRAAGAGGGIYERAHLFHRRARDRRAARRLSAHPAPADRPDRADLRRPDRAGLADPSAGVAQRGSDIGMSRTMHSKPDQIVY